MSEDLPVYTPQEGDVFKVSVEKAIVMDKRLETPVTMTTEDSIKLTIGQNADFKSVTQDYYGQLRQRKRIENGRGPETQLAMAPIKLPSIPRPTAFNAPIKPGEKRVWADTVELAKDKSSPAK